MNKVSRLLSIGLILVNVSLIAQDDDDFELELSPEDKAELAATPVIEPTPPPPAERPAIYIDVPVIGSVKMVATEQGSQATLADQSKKLTLGPLVIDQATLFFDKGGKRRLTGQATLFDKYEATLGLKEYDPKTSLFRIGLTYITKPTLNITPDKGVVLEESDVVLEKDKPTKIIAQTKIAGKPVEITFTVGKQTTDLAVKVPSISLGELITPAASTPLGGVTVSNVFIEAANFLAQNKGAIQYTVKGDADLSSLKTGGVLNDVSLTVQTSKKTGSVVNAVIKKAHFPGVGDIKNATIDAKFIPQQKPTMLLLGDVDFNIPGSEKLTIKISSEIVAQGFRIEGTVVGKPVIAGIHLANVQAVYASREKTFTVQGDATVAGYAATVRATRDVNNAITLEAELKEKELKLFNIPGVTIALRKPRILLEQAAQDKGTTVDQVSMAGTLAILGAELESTLRIIKDPQAKDAQATVIATAKVPPNTNFSVLKGTPLEKFSLADTELVVVNQNYTDKAGVQYAKGVALQVKSVDLFALVPFVRDSLARSVKLNDTVLSLDLSKDQEPVIAIKGMANISAMVKASHLEDDESKVPIDAKVELAKEQSLLNIKRLSFTIPLKNLDISQDVNIRNLSIKALIAQDIKRVDIEGDMHLKAKDIGTIDAKVTMEISSDTAKPLRETLLDEAKFIVTTLGTLWAMRIKLQDLRISLLTSQNIVTVVGFSEIDDLKVQLTITRSAVGNVTAAGTFKDKKIRPFKKLGKGFENIFIKNPTLSMEVKAESNIEISGTTEIFGAEATSKLSLRIDEGKRLAIFSVNLTHAKIPGTTKMLMAAGNTFIDLTKLSIPHFKGTPFDSIQFANLAVAINNRDYVDEKGNLIKKGLHLFGDAYPEGIFSLFKKIGLKADKKTLAVTVNLGDTPDSTSIEVSIPLGINIGKDKVVIGNARFGFSIAGDIKVATLVKVKPTKKDKEFTFAAEGSVNPALSIMEFEGSSEGMWNNAFGLKGLSLDQLGLAFGLNYATGIPTRLGLSGLMKVGKKQASMAVNFELPDATNVGMYGTLSELTIEDLAQLVFAMTFQKVDTSKIPNIGLKDIRILSAPTAFNIGNLVFPEGFELSGGFQLFNQSGYVSFSQANIGFDGKGYINKIDFGPLKITGDGPTGGPIVEVQLGIVPLFHLDAAIAIASIIKAKAKIYYTTFGYKFEAGSSLTINKESKLAMKIEGLISINPKEPGVGLSIVFDNTLFGLLQKYIDKGFKAADKEIQEKLTSAQHDIDKLNKDINDLDRKISGKKKEIDRLKKIIDQKTKEAKGDVVSARNAVDRKRRDLDGIQKKIDKLKKWFKKLPKVSFKGDSKALRGTDYATRLSALETAKGTAEAALTVAREFLDKVIKNIAFDPSSLKESGEVVVLGTEIGGLETAKGTLIASRESAKGVLEGIKQSSHGISKVAKYAFGAIQITHASFKGDVAEIAQGVLPHLSITMKVFDKEYSFNDVNLDLRNPAKSIEHLALSLVERIKQVKEIFD